MVPAIWSRWMKKAKAAEKGAVSKYHVPNLERALDMMELLSSNPHGLVHADIQFGRATVASLCMSAPLERLPDSKLGSVAKVMKDHAIRISRTLGYHHKKQVGHSWLT
jgi:hypothetical protein